MKDEHKWIRDQLKDWGEWRRSGIGAMGYPKRVLAFDPSNYEYIHPPEPSWNKKQIPPEDEHKYRDKRQKSTPPSFTSRIPHYMPHHRLSKLDRRIDGLSKELRKVIYCKFVLELNDDESADYLCRSRKTIERWTGKAYRNLSQNPQKTLKATTVCLHSEGTV